MKILIVDKNGNQITMLIQYNLDGSIREGDVICQQYGYNYKLNKFVEITDHYIIFQGEQVK